MRVYADNEMLDYCGRIDFSDKSAPVFIYPCTCVKMKFKGTSVNVVLRNKSQYWDNYMGAVLDGEQIRVKLSAEDEIKTYKIDDGLEDTEHELLFFKRQDACHVVEFYGFELNEGAKVLQVTGKKKRRIEVYGDSVSAGEVSEAVEYVGKEDPKHNGEYSNSWYSYAWITARKLDADIHDIAQGGVALLNDTGWFFAPNYIGMEQIYDKLSYNPALGEIKKWDFSKYRPHVVIVAIGQNDNHPQDYMAENYNCEKAVYWRKSYKQFIEQLREQYPDTEIILTTTILKHDAAWDKAIDEVCKELNDEKIHHFYYKENGVGTPGHIRIPEAEKMAEELAAYIETLGENIWESEK